MLLLVLILIIVATYFMCRIAINLLPKSAYIATAVRVQSYILLVALQEVRDGRQHNA